MPSSQIFAVNNSGRVFTLLTNEKQWRELEYLGIEFKKVCAHEMVVWALGGDHQIYVYVYGTTVPIRVCEEAYENQRWRPTDGFSHHLLPTDRPAFSSADGLSERSLVAIHLPTLAWQWEGPWTIHTTLAGQQLASEGWTFALDFPRHYSTSQCWNSCVRRRRWTRYRRYVALNTWSAVPSIHQDYTQEPFIDISVGGGEVPGGEPDVLMVWGVTALGKVMVRTGVSGQSPEGYSWKHIPTPAQHDVTSISVGRSGRVWAVTWEGRLLVRTGVCRENSLGTDWQVVEPPSNCPLISVGVGVRSVWGCGRDHSVWFRRGLDQTTVRDGEGDPVRGSVWLSMAGQRLLSISVGPDDQVWGISSGDYTVVARAGISGTELTGRVWQVVAVTVLPWGGEAVDDDTSTDGSEQAPAAMEEVLALQEAAGSGSDIETESLVTSHDRTITELCQRWEPSEQSAEVEEEETSNLNNGAFQAGPSGPRQENLTDKQAADLAAIKLADEAIKHSTNNSNVSVSEGCKREVMGSTSQDKSLEGDEDEDFESATDDSDNPDVYQSTQDLVDGACISRVDDRTRRKRRKKKKGEGGSDPDATVVSAAIENSSVLSSDTSTDLEATNVLDESQPCRNRKFDKGNPNLPYPILPSTPAPATQHFSELRQFSSEAPLVPCIPSTVFTSVSPATSTVARSSSVPPPHSPSRSRHPSSSSDSSATALHQASALGLRGAVGVGEAGGFLPSLEEHLWLGVSGGGCWVHPSHWPDWFSGGADHSNLAWRENISYQLYDLQRRLQPFRGLYREVVQGGSWTVTGRCRWLTGGHWHPATVSLTTPHQEPLLEEGVQQHSEEGDGTPATSLQDGAVSVAGSGSNKSESASSKSVSLQDEAGVEGEESDGSEDGVENEEEKFWGRGNTLTEPVLMVEFTSRSKKKFSIAMSTLLVMRIHVQPPSRCLLALYCSSHPHEPYCLQYNSEHTAEEWADNFAGAVWHFKQSLSRRALAPPTPLQTTPTAVPTTIVSHEVCKTTVNTAALIETTNARSFESTSDRAEMDKLEWTAKQRCSQLRHRPTPFSIWATTLDGAVFFHDSAAPTKSWCCLEGGEHRLPVTQPRGCQVYSLLAGFTEGSSLTITFTVDLKPNRFHINLQSSASSYCAIALHCNPRIAKKVVVLNAFQGGLWQQEERHKLPGFTAGSRNTLVIACQKQEYKLVVNGRAWHNFSHRVSCESVSHLLTDGDITVTSVTYSHGPVQTALPQHVWEGVGGHMVRVAAGGAGVIWALSNDCHVYTYTGGRGGGPYKALGGHTSHGLVHPESDVVHDYLWENQRWNPVTGFSARGLPTDRPAWTQNSRPLLPMTREEMRLPSRHWTWTSEWNVDFHPPGGCDSEGWQHATDFPLNFHGHCYVTDLVRRRRWKRRRRITTSGPWLQLGRTPLVHVDVSSSRSSDGTIAVWGVSVSGEVLLRTGVTPNCPEGLAWSMVTTDCPVAAICVDMGPCLPHAPDPAASSSSPSTDRSSNSSRGERFPPVSSERKSSAGEVRVSYANGAAGGRAQPTRGDRGPSHCQVWCVTRDGRALVRIGVTPSNPSGIQWADVDAPGTPLQSVQAGAGTVWALDQSGNLYRRAKTQPLFPEGTSWTLVCGGVSDLSVASSGEVWAVVNLPHTPAPGENKDKGDPGTAAVGCGMLGRRIGITKDQPLGTDWQFAAGTGWSTVNAKMMLTQE